MPATSCLWCPRERYNITGLQGAHESRVLTDHPVDNNCGNNTRKKHSTQSIGEKCYRPTELLRYFHDELDLSTDAKTIKANMLTPTKGKKALVFVFQYVTSKTKEYMIGGAGSSGRE